MNDRVRQDARVRMQIDEAPRAELTGDWVIRRLGPAERDLAYARWPSEGEVTVDGSGVASMDTAGAWLVVRLARDLENRGVGLQLTGFGERERGLLRLSQTGFEGEAAPSPAARAGMLERIGRATLGLGAPLFRFLSFCGDVFLCLGRCVVSPGRLRGAQVVGHLYSAGLLAIPIAGLLSFLMGVVIAYQGAVLLQWYGADIFTVDLVGLSMARELAPLLTAIIVAGRTGSAFTAQIGTMSVTDEVDALRSIGVGPMEYLVLPRLIALVIALPLLTVFADVAGILGGFLMTWVQLGFGWATFVERLEYALTFKSFTLGLIKTPTFAAIIALIGCYQGFQVRGGAESVGRHTTVCVVQSLFLVIVADAAYSIYYSWLGL